MQLTGKTALVTGASRGLGKAIAASLVRSGARVFVTARHESGCRAVAAELEEYGTCIALPADLSSEHECIRLGHELPTPLHFLVNCAGTAWAQHLETFPPVAWDKVLNLNLRAPFLLVQALLGHLRAAATREDPARVITIGSMEGLRAPDQPTYSYSASKAAVHHLTRVLARQLGASGITVNAVAPGVVRTEMTAPMLAKQEAVIRERTPLGRLGSPEDVAAAVLYLAGPGGGFITGAVLPVDGGLSMTL